MYLQMMASVAYLCCKYIFLLYFHDSKKHVVFQKDLWI